MFVVYWIAGPEAPALSPVVGTYPTEAEAEAFASRCREGGETVEVRRVPPDFLAPPWFGAAV